MAGARGAGAGAGGAAGRAAAAVGVPGARLLLGGGGARGVLHELLARAGGAPPDALVAGEDADELERVRAFVPPADTLGNAPGVRTWEGPLGAVPGYMGPFDGVVLTDEALEAWGAGSSGAFGEGDRALLRGLCALVRPGGEVVLSRTGGLGAGAEVEAMAGLGALVEGLPLERVGVESGEDHFMARLRVPERFALPGGPAEGVALAARVVSGFGRGSREMGVPTANLDVPQVEAALVGRPHGVYFGFARVLGAEGADGEVHPMVLNLGQRPTFADGDGISVEAHLLHSFSGDFYGREVRALVLGFLRPELKFASLPDLLDRIRADIGLARAQLSDPALGSRALDRHFFAAP